MVYSCYDILLLNFFFKAPCCLSVGRWMWLERSGEGKPKFSHLTLQETIRISATPKPHAAYCSYLGVGPQGSIH